MCTPWGGFPEGTLEDPKSGLGWVHNTYLLDSAQKTVIEGPLTMMPKPFWFPTHRTANILAREDAGPDLSPRLVEVARPDAAGIRRVSQALSLFQCGCHCWL